MISDGLLAAVFGLAILTTSYPMLIPVTTVLLSFLLVSGHNYLHLRDNFRMFYTNLTFMNFAEWRVTHAMSHHMFTNSLVDIELLWLAPMLCWIPRADAKGWVARYVSWLYSPLVYASFFVLEIFKR